MGDGGAHESHPYSITISLLRVLNNPKYELFQKVFPFSEARISHYNIYILSSRGGTVALDIINILVSFLSY